LKALFAMVDGMDFVDDVDIETTTCEVVPIE
jgi:hypothetical protein